jgi:hypothetical protein
MLESPLNPTLLYRTDVWYSDNVMGADNQQERLIRLGWVLGFVDGEGCFSLGLVRQTRRQGRAGYGTGYQVFHEFVVAQGERSLECLHDLRDFFGVGMVLVNRRHDDHREPMHRYVVRRRKDLIDVVIPFFREYPLRSAKRRDFEKFAGCIERMQAAEHLTSDGLAGIVEVIGTMNRRKPREDLIRILRGHTPDA